MNNGLAMASTAGEEPGAATAEAMTRVDGGRMAAGDNPGGGMVLPLTVPAETAGVDPDQSGSPHCSALFTA
jgi:hypothetical protein